MKKLTILSVGACLTLSMLLSTTPAKATDFTGREEEYAKTCSSSSLSNNDKAVCTEFNQYLKDKNKEVKNQIKDSKAAINNTQADIDEVESQLIQLNDDIETKKVEIDYLNTSISNLENDIERKEEEVKERMYSMQSQVNSNVYASFIFGAEDFTDMFSRINNVQELTSYDKELILGLQQDRLDLEEQKQTVATAIADLEEQQSAQKGLQAKYLALLDEQNGLLSNQQDLSAHLEDTSSEVQSALDLLAEKSKQTEITRPVAPSGDSEVGLAIAQAGLTKVGLPYTWGATGPSSFDCSGLVWWAHNQSGVKFGRTTAQGYSQYGQAISASEAQAGDVVTFFGYGYVCHIGIIIDNNGNMVHASGRANEQNGQWGGRVRVNNIYEIGLSVYNFRRLY